MESYINITRAVDVLRSEPSLNNSSTCIEQLSWILLLKFVDNVHYMCEDGGDFDIEGIPSEFRWSTWFRNSSHENYLAFSTRENSLLQFVEGKLFPYLRSLSQRHSEGTLLANLGTVFSNLNNRITSSQTLLAVMQIVDEIDCIPLDEYGAIFDKLIQDLANSGGSYMSTPLPLARALVQVMAPEVGETIYDPAAGSGRLLKEAAIYLGQTRRRERNLTSKRATGLFAAERNRGAFALTAMNTIFHLIEPVHLQYGDTLTEEECFSVDSPQFDLILSNPPFGGKTESVHSTQFNVETNSRELLFLQKCMKSLRVGGRAALIVSEGVLSQRSGPAMAVKRQLLQSFNLHTILSLPAGAFAPATAIKASVLFFDNTYPTKETWIYECRTEKTLSKNRPLNTEHLADFVDNFQSRKDSHNAKKVHISDLSAHFDLSARSYIPEQRIEAEHLNVTISRVREAIESSVHAIRQISSQVEFETLQGLSLHVEKVPLKDLCTLMKHGFAGRAIDSGDVKFIRITDLQGGEVDWHGAQYVDLGVRQHQAYALNKGDILFARVGATAGKSSLIRDVPVTAVFASNLIKLVADSEKVIPEYLYLYFQSRAFLEKIDKSLSGTVQLNISGTKLGSIEIPVPPIPEQAQIVDLFGKIYDQSAQLTVLAEQSCLGLRGFRTSLLQTLFQGI